MTKDFKWPYKTYYVEVVPFHRILGQLIFNGPASVPDINYGDVILTSRTVILYKTLPPFSDCDHTIATALEPEEADELVQLLGVKLEAFFR